MPEVLVAGGYGLDACVAVIDGEIERGGTIATLSVGESCRLDRRRSIGCTVPGVAVAGGDGLGAGGAMVDCEVERGGAVATHRIER